MTWLEDRINELADEILAENNTLTDMEKNMRFYRVYKVIGGMKHYLQEDGSYNRHYERARVFSNIYEATELADGNLIEDA